jgi:cobalt-precorrin 5A hydrolase/precorrin-3B C17-methyltransferase
LIDGALCFSLFILKFASLWQTHRAFIFGLATGAVVRLIAPLLQDKSSDLPKVQWHPRVLWVGIGCERGTSRELIETAIIQTCQRYHLAVGAIAGIATIDLKADETGLVEFCQAHNLPFQTFSAKVLRSVKVPTPSMVVNQAVGTPSVAEAAALVCSQCVGERAQGFAPLLPLLVKKQIVRMENQPGAVTVAIAVAQQEYIGRTGQLVLVCGKIFRS